MSWSSFVHLYVCVCVVRMDLPGGSVVKNPPAMQETQVASLGQEDPLQEEMATHSSILAWEIPWRSLAGLKSQTQLSMHACVICILCFHII